MSYGDRLILHALELIKELVWFLVATNSYVRSVPLPQFRDAVMVMAKAARWFADQAYLSADLQEEMAHWWAHLESTVEVMDGRQASTTGATKHRNGGRA